MGWIGGGHGVDWIGWDGLGLDGWTGSGDGMGWICAALFIL